MILNSSFPIIATKPLNFPELEPTVYKTHFYPDRVPNTCEELLDLLSSCSPRSFHPLIQTINFSLLPEEIEKWDGILPFPFFCGALAYPIQSYEMNEELKTQLVGHCFRLYPHEMGIENNPLQSILQRIKISSTGDIRLDDLNRLPFLNDVQNLKEKLPYDFAKRKNQVALEWEGVRQENRAVRTPKQIQTALSLIFFEHQFIHKIASLLASKEACLKLQSHIKLFNLKKLRISPHIGIFPNDISQDQASNVEIALAIQYNQIVSKVNHTLKNLQSLVDGRRVLHQIYGAFKELSEKNDAEFCKKTEKIFRYSIANMILLIEWDDIAETYLHFLENNKKEDSKLDTLGDTKELIAPFYKHLIFTICDIRQQYANDYKSFATTECLLTHFISNIRYLCDQYQSFFPEQKKIYRDLHDQWAQKTNKNSSLKAVTEKYIFRSNSKDSYETLPIQLDEISFDFGDPVDRFLNASLEEVEDIIPVDKKTSHSHAAKGKNKKKKGAKSHIKNFHDKPTESIPDLTREIDLNPPLLPRPAIIAIEEESLKSENKEFDLTSPILVPIKNKAPIFNYANRVLRWFNMEASPPFNRTKFYDYDNCMDSHLEEMRNFHAFSRTVDDYVKELGYLTKCQNRTTKKPDELLLLPGELCVQQKKTRGVFVYCTNEEGITYHRFFSEKPVNELVKKVINRAFLEADFPELKVSLTSGEFQEVKQPTSNSSDDEIIAIHPILKTVTITNKSSKITLFPTRTSVGN